LIPGALCVLVIAYLIHEELTRTAGGPAIARLSHGGEEERVAACQALGQLTGEESGAAVPELVAASRDPSSLVRREAVDALMRIGVRSGAVLSALVDAVEDKDAGVRTRAVLALGMLRMATPPVTAALTTALVDLHPEVREAAATALGMMAPLGAPGIAAPGATVEND
jgi:HEAT repeat protein